MTDKKALWLTMIQTECILRKSSIHLALAATVEESCLSDESVSLLNQAREFCEYDEMRKTPPAWLRFAK